MALRDRLVDGFERATGLAVTPRERLNQLTEAEGQLGYLVDEAEDLALMALDYAGGRPHELRAGQRRRLTQESRIALMRDPLAGAEANIRANFTFGRGVGQPNAKEPRVQTIIDRAWRDPNNRRKLTSFAAQRKRSNELITSANLFPVAFTRNGRVKLGFLDSDLVTDIVPDPNDDETPLYYVTRKRVYEWDPKTDRPKLASTMRTRMGVEKVWYYAHWQALEDAERAAGHDDDLTSLPTIPKEKIAEGKVEHFAINQVSRSQFGTPPWARTLRFYSAMNALTEAQVQMRQGAATLVAKRIRRGGPSDIAKAAGNLLNQVGNLATSSAPWGLGNRFGGGAPAPQGPGTEPQGAAPPPPAGSILIENESDSLQAVNLSSGAAQAAQDAQIVRAPIAAASQFGQHWFGDASNANLATASTLDLPSGMEIGSWQETFEGIFRWFTDLSIETAIKSGQLGGLLSEADDPDSRPLEELSLAQDREELEKRTGLDLSYSFEMPYPGRRNLPEVVEVVTGIAEAYDPQGQNPKLRRILLDFLFRHGLQVEDPSAEVDEVWPENFKPEPFQQTAPPPGQDGALPDGKPPKGKPDGGLGAPRRTATAKGEMGKPAYAAFPGQMKQALQEADIDPSLLDALSADVEREFASLLSGTALTNGASANGSTPH